MKSLFFGLFFVGAVGILSAQTTSAEQKAAEAANTMKEKLQLSERQQEKMHKIQMRRYSDRELIAPNKISDSALYLEQLKAIEYGTDVSIQLILSSSQEPLFKAFALERRERYARISAPMLAQGLPIEQVEIAILESE